MQTDLLNRTGHHNYSVDLTCDTMTRPVTPASELSTLGNTLTSNPLYVVNYSNTRPDKNVNISRERMNALYQEPQDMVSNRGDGLYDSCQPPSQPVLQ